MTVVNNTFVVSEVSLLPPEEKVIATEYLRIFSTNTLEHSGLIKHLNTTQCVQLQLHCGKWHFDYE